MEKLCNLCPRNCNVDRSTKLGFCGANEKLKVAKVMLHYFEEPIISGEDTPTKKAAGSGAIFFSNCNLKCVFCQNEEISHGGVGKEISISRLAEIFKELESAGANNINLVTPSHYTDQIISALKIYRPKIPIVWNTSGYEKVETIKKLDGIVDIYLTDFKYFDGSLAKKLSAAPDYPEATKAAILEMKKSVPEDIIAGGLMKKGLIVRNLVLPNQAKDSINVLNWVKNNLGKETYISIMSQYVPMGKAKEIEELNRRVSPLEYKVVVSSANRLGLDNAFIQDLSSATSDYTPDFLSQTDEFKI